MNKPFLGTYRYKPTGRGIFKTTYPSVVRLILAENEDEAKLKMQEYIEAHDDDLDDYIIRILETIG